MYPSAPYFCQKDGHSEDTCWKAHPELIPEWEKARREQEKKKACYAREESDDSDEESSQSTRSAGRDKQRME